MTKTKHFNIGISQSADNSGHPHCLHGRRECGRLSRPCSCLMAGGMSCCLCGASISSLSEHVSPEQSWSPSGWFGVIALIRTSGMFRLQLGCYQWYVLAPTWLLWWDVASWC